MVVVSGTRVAVLIVGSSLKSGGRRHLLWHADDQGAGLDPRVKTSPVVYDLTVYLPGHDPICLDQDPAATEAFKLRILRAIAAKYPPRQPDPVAQGPRRHDDHVEQTVVDRCVRQQLESALQPSDIADQYRAGRPAQRRAVVDAQLYTNHRVAQVPEAAEYIGGPAGKFLHAVRGVRHHRRVETDAGHDGERQVSDPAEVNAPVHTVAGHREGVRRLDGYAEVAREQVAGAEREERDRHIRRRGVEEDRGAHHRITTRRSASTAASRRPPASCVRT